MKTIYLELNMGAAGDMLMAALLELHPEPEAFLSRMNALSLPGVHAHAEPSIKCGVTGTRVSVHIHGREEHSLDASEHENESDHEHEHGHHHGHHHEHEHHHEHAGLSDIEKLIRSLPIDARAIEDALNTYRLIADAESRAHGVPVDQVHFHEVGALDAVFDIVGVCLLVSELAPDEIIASSVRAGYGMVKCQHGILPVPAPATAHILSEARIPFYAGRFEGELLTPTGAALIARFVSRFEEMPAMRVEKIGYGMGNKDFPAANCVRAFLGERESDHLTDVVELSCDIDDQTGETLAYAQKVLLDAGALDAVLRPAVMKKGRPAVTLSVLASPSDEERMAKLIFRHTTTIGVRVAKLKRYALERSTETADTKLGPVGVKRSAGFGVTRKKLEYEDLARIARERGWSLEEVKSALADLMD